MPDIRIAADPDSLARQAAEAFVGIANAAIRENDVFSVSLSGGSTPKALYSLLASEEYRPKVVWPKVHFFFGDERNVTSDDARSNYRMARETLFEPLKIDESNVVPWITSLGSPPEVAEMYELAVRMAFDPELDPARNGSGDQELRSSPPPNLWRNGLPVFDLVLLGLGPDGHTASLFPQTSALAETEKIATSNWVPKLNEFRLTTTFPVINNADAVMFLVSGAEKADAVSAVIVGKPGADPLPAQLVRPAAGKLIWMLDEPAAALLLDRK